MCIFEMTLRKDYSTICPMGWGPYKMAIRGMGRIRLLPFSHCDFITNRKPQCPDMRRGRGCIQYDIKTIEKVYTLFVGCGATHGAI